MDAAAALLHALATRASVERPVLLVAAHPDDETVGAGASLYLFRTLRIVHVTDGAPPNLMDARAAGFGDAAGYAAARRAELHAALRAGGVRAALLELHAPDQQASLRMAALARQLAGMLKDAAAAIVHPYEGGHPDHDAAAFITHAAVALAGSQAGIVEMASYHAAPDGGMATGGFLPGGPDAVTVALDAAEQARKRAMLEAFTTQRATLAPFGVAQESFRRAPRYDFTAPPHPGALHYEHYDWGMDGKRWRSLAAVALRELGLA